ncbi:hypothetical protein Moror_15457, partial [Moniliophthora roreri MCA 2997]
YSVVHAAWQPNIDFGGLAAVTGRESNAGNEDGFSLLEALNTSFALEPSESSCAKTPEYIPPSRLSTPLSYTPKTSTDSLPSTPPALEPHYDNLMVIYDLQTAHPSGYALCNDLSLNMLQLFNTLFTEYKPLCEGDDVEMDIDTSISHGDFPDKDIQIDLALGAVKDIPQHDEEECPFQRVEELETEQEQDEDHKTLAECHRWKAKEHAQNIEHFLDLEAEVSQDEDNNNNNGDMDNFIADDHDFEGQWIDAAYQSLAMQPIAQKNQDELQEAEKLANRFNKKARYQLSVEHPSTSSQNSIVSSWVIHCKPKKNHLVITYILDVEEMGTSTWIPRCLIDWESFSDNVLLSKSSQDPRTASKWSGWMLSPPLLQEITTPIPVHFLI